MNLSCGFSIQVENGFPHKSLCTSCCGRDMMVSPCGSTPLSLVTLHVANYGKSCINLEKLLGTPGVP